MQLDTEAVATAMEHMLQLHVRRFGSPCGALGFHVVYAEFEDVQRTPMEPLECDSDSRRPVTRFRSCTWQEPRNEGAYACATRERYWSRTKAVAALLNQQLKSC